MIFADTNILLRSVQTSDPFSITRAALTKLRARQEIVCIAPQSLVEFWVVATRPRGAENGLGFPHARAASEITMLQGLFHMLPYKPEVLETWKRIVTLHGVTGKQAHDAHLVAMMQVHSVASILTFNTGISRASPALQFWTRRRFNTHRPGVSPARSTCFPWRENFVRRTLPFGFE